MTLEEEALRLCVAFVLLVYFYALTRLGQPEPQQQGER